MLAMLRRRWHLVAGLALAGMVVMSLVSLFTPRRWTAKAVLHVITQPPQVTNLPQVVAPPSYFEGIEYFQDQVKFLESRSLAAHMIHELGLERVPAFVGTQARLGRAERGAARGSGCILAPLGNLLPAGKETRTREAFRTSSTRACLLA